MRTQKNAGEEKGKIVFTFLILLLISSPLTADTVWVSGHHEINDGDMYGEIWMYNDCTLDIFGGTIGRLAAYDTTVTDWYDGSMNTLWTRENSIVNIFGGLLDRFDPGENGLVNLYAYDVVHHTTGGYWDGGWIEGRYLVDDSYFNFDIPGEFAVSHINIVPEPSTLVLISLGLLFLRKR
jgi:hypothetical protein